MFSGNSILLTVIVFLLPALTHAGPTTSPAELPETCYLFASFHSRGDGLHLAYSTDGLNWTEIGNGHIFLRPQVGSERLMRDPCILLGPDGIYQMVWTTGWYGRDIGYASSKDLIHWSQQRAVPVMENEPTAMNCWAPEVVFDEAKKHYLIFWATTIPGRFKATDQSGNWNRNHRIYSTTTTDFVTFTPAKLFYDPGFNVIDATMVHEQDKFYLVFKDETAHPLKKVLHVTSGLSVEGPFGEISPSFTPAFSEGPSVLKVGDQFFCYYDFYPKQTYGAAKSKDLLHWEDVTAELKMPRGIRHGTALPIRREVLLEVIKGADDENAKP